MSLTLNEDYTGASNLQNIYTVDPVSGRRIRVTDNAFADLVIHTKSTEGPWGVLDLLIKHWISTKPKEYKSYVTDVEMKKDTRGTAYGQGKSSSALRFTLDIPEKIMLMFRTIYKPDEFPFDKKFFKEFWERYPQFRVAERL